jgi:hypothetical protein
MHLRPLIACALLAAACGEVKSDDADARGPSTDPDAPPAEVVDGGDVDTEADAATDAPPGTPDAPVPCEWTAPLQLLRAPDDAGANTAPAVTANQRTMYFTSQERAPAVLTATRSAAEGAWVRGGTATSGAYGVEDVSADGVELIMVDLGASRLMSAVRDATTGRFGTPVAVGLPVAPVSISPDRTTLYVLDGAGGQVLASTRAAGGTWPTPRRVLSWTELQATSVDVGPGGDTLLLTGPDGAAISRRVGGSWSPPAPLRGLDGAMAHGDLVADDLVYFDVVPAGGSSELYYSRCVVPQGG